jgi:hypothetical protein
VVTAPKVRALGSPDFKVFYTAAHFAWTAPEKMYAISPDRYLYPPSAAILLAPFGYTDDFTRAQWVWHGLLAFLVFVLASRSWAALLAMALLTRYLLVTFAYGQINLLIVALLALSGSLLGRGSAAAGGIWALATSLKVYPIVFAPAFFAREKRRGLYAGFAAGLIILALPFLFFGPTLSIDLYRQFFDAIANKGMPLHSHNQSVVALLSRFFTNQNFYLHAVGNAQWNILSLPPQLVRWAAILIGLAIAAVSWRKVRKGDATEALSAAAFSILFLSHIVWKDYFLLLYFPLSELFEKLPRRASWALGLGFLAIVTLSSPDILGAPLAATLDGSCVHLWGAVLVWVAWLRLKK